MAEPKTVVHKVEVGRSAIEQEQDAALKAKDATIRALQQQLQDKEDEAIARALTKSEKLKERARAVGIPESALDVIMGQDDLKTLEAWVQQSEAAGITAPPPPVERGGKPTDPPQGSLVQLEGPTGITQKKEYSTYGEMVDDLYIRSEAGDKKAKSQLDRLWGKLEGDMRGILKRDEKLPTIHLSQCTKCWGGPVVDGVCTTCGANRNE